jgi:hypothetical protein
MSILRHFNKHQGWHDGKRTPFGGGGGWNPVSFITDPISEALGTDGSGGGVLGALADADPGPAIGQGLAEADKFVTRELPGGWALPAIVTAAVLAPELAPELAQLGIESGIETAAGQDAFWSAIANGATSSEAVSAGLAAETAGAGALTTGEILGSGGFTPVDGASFAIDPAASYTAGTSSALTTPEILNSTGFTPTAETPFTVDPNFAYTPVAEPIPTDIGMGTNAPLQGPTYQELGVTGVPEGGMGPTYAEMGNTGLNTEQAISAADAVAKQSQLAEALKTANQVRQVASTANNLAKLLSPAAKTVAKTGTNANSQFINAAQNLAQYTPEQFGGYYQMNKNPFTFSNPMASALKNKDATGLDVSGTGGQALNTTNQIANLLRTLA